MSSPDEQPPIQSLHARLCVIEAALALPHEVPAAPAASADARALQLQLLKSELRVTHLSRAYDAHVLELAALRAQLASLSSK